jgi:hypothetical protein
VATQFSKPSAGGHDKDSTSSVYRYSTAVFSQADEFTELSILILETKTTLSILLVG